MYKLLVRKNVILDAGLKKEKDHKQVIPFNNISIKVGTTVDPKNVVIPTISEMKDLIISSIGSSHKHIIGEIEVATIQEAQHKIDTYNAGHDITLKDGTILNSTIALPGDIIYFVDTNHVFQTEEVLIDSAKQMILLTVKNAAIQASSTNTAAIAALTPKVTANTAAATKNVTDIATNVTNITKNNADIVSNKKLIDANTVLSKANKVEIDGIKPKVHENELGLQDYFNNKADFVLSQDIQHKVINHISTNTKPTKAGKDYTWTLAAADVANFKVGSMTTIKTQDTTTSVMEYFKDSYNDGHGTTINTGTNREFVVTLTDTTLTVHSNEDLSNHVLKYLVQEEGATSAVAKDQVARDKGDANLIKINKNITDITKNTGDITTNTTDISNKLDAVIPTLPTAAKGVEGAIKEINTKADLAKTLSESLKNKDIMKEDGTFVDLNTMDESGLGTDEDKVLITVKAVKKLIADALATVMHVTFDDASTDDYKIGK